MSYYGKDQNWHQHSQTTPNYNTNAPPLIQANGTSNQTNGQPRQPIGPVINQAVGNIVNDLQSNMDKEYFKTTCGLLSCVEVIAVLVLFIISTNLQSYTFLTLIAGFSFWLSLLFLLINLFQLPEKITVLPWPRMQFGFTLVASLLFFLESFILLFYSGILCLLTLHVAALYGYHTYDKLKEIGRVITAQQNPQQTVNLNV